MGVTPLTYDILLALADAPRHGYGIIREVEDRSPGEAPSTGALYLALRRMTGDGLVEEAPSPRGADARRRYYRLTPAGIEVARAESERLATLVAGAREKRLLPGGAS